MPDKKLKLKSRSVSKPLRPGLQAKGSSGKAAPQEPSRNGDSQLGAPGEEDSAPSPLLSDMLLKSATLRVPASQTPVQASILSVMPSTNSPVRFQPGVIVQSSGEQPPQRTPALEGLSSYVNSRQAAKTGVLPNRERQAPPPSEAQASFESSDVVEAAEAAAVFNEALQNYLDICDMTLREWTPLGVIDSLHILVKGLGLDVVSMAVIDPDRTRKFLPVISRGYHVPPTLDISSVWESCISSDSRTVSWSSLMDVTGEAGSPLAEWLAREDFQKFGYAPIHDGKVIHGFLIIGAYDKSRISAFAAQFLEMLGGRLGLSLGFHRNRGEWPANVLRTIKSLRDSLSLQMGLLDMLSESAKLSPEELSSLLSNGSRSLCESVALLDRLTEEAAGLKAGR